MRKASVVGVLTALVCLGVSDLVVTSSHYRAVVANTNRISEAARRVAMLAKQHRLPSVVPADGAAAIQVLNSQGQVVAATRQIAGKAPMASFQAGEDRMFSAQDKCPPAGLRGCMTVASVRFVKPEQGNWVAFAAGPVPAVYGNTLLLASLAGVSALLTAMAAAGTRRSVRRTLAPFEAIEEELAEITASGLGRRITVPTGHEEVGRLAEGVNSTLDRLEAALEGLRRYDFEVTHDLRTPITAIRIRLEDALMYPDDTQWPHMAAKVMGEVQRLQAVVSDLADSCTARNGQPPPPQPPRPR